LAELQNPNLVTVGRGLQTLGSQTVQHVSLALPDPVARRVFGRKLDENLEVFLDPQTMLIVRTDRLGRSEQDIDMRIPSTLEFSDFRNVGNITIAFRIVNTTGTSEIGTHRSTVVVSSVQLNSSIPDSVFLPAGGSQ